MPILRAFSASSFHSFHLSNNSFAQASGLPPFEVVLLFLLSVKKMHVIVPVCTWAPSRAGVLKYECNSASAQQKNCKEKYKNK